jgi:hypothetical protein
MWGYGVEDDQTFPAVLARELPGTETINLGANGYNMVQEFVRLDEHGLRYSPDWVVAFFCSNDLDSNFDDKDGGRPRLRLEPDGGFAIENRPVRTPWKSTFSQWIRHHSSLFVFGEYGARVTRDRIEQAHAGAALAAGGDVNGASIAIPPAGEDAGEIKIAEVEMYAGAPRVAQVRAWNGVEYLLGRMRDLAASRGARLLVVPAVDMLYVVPSAQRELVKLSTLPASAFDWDRPSRTLAEISARLGVAFVDPTPAFRAQPDQRALFLARNRHWSVAGQRLMAEQVAARLREIDGH